MPTLYKPAVLLMEQLTAIVFADRLGQELRPLTQRTCPALLPVATKSLLEHALDALCQLNIKQVLLVVSDHAEQIQALCGDGQRWQMQVDYMLSLGEELPSHVLDRLGDKLKQNSYLLLRGDMLFSFDLDAFVKTVLTDTQHLSVFARINGHCAGVGILRRQTQSRQAKLNPWLASNALQWRLETLQNRFSLHLKNLPNTTGLDVNGDVSLLNNFAAYQQTNFACLQARFQHLVMPFMQRGAAPQLWQGRSVNIPGQTEGMYGAYCHVHHTAQIQHSVLSEYVLVGRHSHIQDSLILPYSYIGEHISVQHAIVWGDTLIRVDNGAILKLQQRFILTDLRHPYVQSASYVGLQRSLAVLLLILSAPLWLVALLWTTLRDAQPALRQLTLNSHHQVVCDSGTWQPKTFTTWEWQLPSPILRHLPKLWAVVKGHIRLVGVSPETPQQAQQRTLDWEMQRDLAPIGLLGPAQLSLPAEALVEERYLLEGYYARTRSLQQDAYWLWQGLLALFKPKNWKI